MKKENWLVIFLQFQKLGGAEIFLGVLLLEVQPPLLRTVYPGNSSALKDTEPEQSHTTCRVIVKHLEHVHTTLKNEV